MSEQSPYTPDDLGVATVRTSPSIQGKSLYFVVPVLVRHRLAEKASRVSVCKESGNFVLRPGAGEGFVDYSAAASPNITIGAKACHALDASEGDQIRIHDGEKSYRLELISEQQGANRGTSCDG